MEPQSGPSVSFLCGQLGAGSNVPPAQGWGTQWGNRRETGKWYLFFSPSFLLRFILVARIWREKGQELRMAGIYKLRVQPAFGKGEGKGAPFAKTIFIFLKGSYKAMIKPGPLKQGHKNRKIFIWKGGKSNKSFMNVL